VKRREERRWGGREERREKKRGEKGHRRGGEGDSMSVRWSYVHRP
jgi:hypothetical protein